MPEEAYFDLSPKDKDEVLEVAREKTGRPAHLLEKDVWVVWTLGELFKSEVGADLTFKGGTSLSKAYKLIDRFSEDLDITYDIRRLIPDLTRGEAFLPESRSQAKKWTAAVRDRLPLWIDEKVRPLLEAALARDKLEAKLEVTGDKDKLLLHYPAIKRGTGYVAPWVLLEFGGRSTGEPHGVVELKCDMAGHVDGVTFPTASPLVMSVARTFWEKATATHVYCAQGHFRGERYARHWHDLAAIMRSHHFQGVVEDREVARSVADHKSSFFIEKDTQGNTIDYHAAVEGGLRIVPEGEALAALEADYAKMLEDEVMVGDALPFADLIAACGTLAERANANAKADGGAAGGGAAVAQG